MKIICRNAGVKFPIFNTSQRSLRKSILGAATGGRIGTSASGITEVEALKNISFSLYEGDRLALVGHNGSGKTTLLRVLAGAYKPTSGHFERTGRVTSLIDPMMGMDGELTGMENIRLRGLFLGLSRQAIKNMTDEIIEFSELGNFIKVPVRTYSSGMVLRLGFSISTAITPEILLMDEWMSVGDSDFRKKAEERLNSFISKAGILVMATHDHGLADAVCNQVIRLEHGEIVSHEQP
ncbi:TPA: ABC transporter ATP-binding protein [Salmonella enterica subsp. enterica serovar Welikade]|uniref:ABC transporter ATP-binding protein n=1 Tax=Salmonella sp. SG203 TaxID=2555397 RepID=UPI001584013D|nr:ABC transporter ATP-binding protein [Salmonella sp. SG203]EGB0326520.1 ABC transporter ATP-binding protein [Salmonella enterica]HEC8684660.1 ABC transporter ATP-binding protein [Salmonella enterica subsp. enterica serovar Oranienburg]HEC9415715.1 ABC transporter ATP-binding protein [Salmonella enterica subsp. enterica serovar Poona]EKB5038710.1 ABC transporter ATP-binding protein [Salmonella enterica]EME1064275.1 ABC transporter ATP-binding protein [Salmonella enterica]